MKLSSLLPKFLRPKRRRATSSGDSTEARDYDKSPLNMERFAPLNRLNQGHFARANGQSINEELNNWLPSLMAWCEFEYSRSPLFQGVVNTFKDDVVGRDGPLLQVTSDYQAFNDAVEEAWWEVFDDPDPSHRYGGVECMKTWVQGLLIAGSYVNINATVERDFPVSFGWRAVHARRLVTPSQFAGDPDVAFGTRYNPTTGAPIEHYIAKPARYAGMANSGALSTEFDTVPAAALQHCFIPFEPEQLTGSPLLSVSIETAADLRDYDKYVMQAAKNAAAHAVGLQVMHPEAVVDPDPIPGNTYQVRPGEVNVAPLGWAWQSLTATQPNAQYTEFRHERGAEIGRPIHMPLLVVFLTAAEANFASAQYEGTVYTDGVASIQGFIERRSLNRFVLRNLIPELVLRRGLRVPKKFDLVWTWNKPAHANIERFVKAIETMVELGIIAPSQASAMLGYDWEKVVDARKKNAQQLDEAGLPPTPTKQTGTPAKEDSDPDDPPKPTSNPRKRNARFSVTP